MSFFSRKKKQLFGSQKSNEIKNTIEVICPSCQHAQTEPTKALSSNCRKCSTYFKIEKGVAIDSSPSASPFQKKATEQAPEKQGEALTKKEEPNHTPPKNTPIKAQTSPVNHEKKAKQEPTEKKEPRIKPNQAELIKKDSLAAATPKQDPSTAAKTKPEPLVKQELKIEPEKEAVEEKVQNEIISPPESVSYFKKNDSLNVSSKTSAKKPKGKNAPRDVQCFDCSHIHQAPSQASSTNCPKCGSYITLNDIDIRTNSNQRIHTRGNVTIYKKASASTTKITCHHLTVNGSFAGEVDCSGDLTLNQSFNIDGEIHCKHLIIAKRANIEFAKHIYAQDVTIDGTTTGNFTCTGKLELKKRATLTGDIKVATMTMEEGAKHNGQMSIGC